MITIAKMLSLRSDSLEQTEQRSTIPDAARPERIFPKRFPTRSALMPALPPEFDIVEPCDNHDRHGNGQEAEIGRREPTGPRPPTPPDILSVSGGFFF
jgi:hypothetical protein